VNHNSGVPGVVKFHPYQSELAVADKEGISYVEYLNLDVF